MSDDPFVSEALRIAAHDDAEAKLHAEAYARVAWWVGREDTLAVLDRIYQLQRGLSFIAAGLEATLDGKGET